MDASEPAFPYVTAYTTARGLTKREYIAVHLCAAVTEDTDMKESNLRELARLAVKQADILIEELSKSCRK